MQSLHQHHQCHLRCGKGRERLGEGALLSPAAAALPQGRVPRDSQPSPLEMLARRHFPAHCNGPASVREPCLPASPEAEALTFAVVVSCTVTSEDPCRVRSETRSKKHCNDFSVESSRENEFLKLNCQNERMEYFCIDFIAMNIYKT